MNPLHPAQVHLRHPPAPLLRSATIYAHRHIHLVGDLFSVEGKQLARDPFVALRTAGDCGMLAVELDHIVARCDMHDRLLVQDADLCQRGAANAGCVSTHLTTLNTVSNRTSSASSRSSNTVKQCVCAAAAVA